MSHIISYSKYRYIIRRKIPCIIYYDDERYYKNAEILIIMEEMRRKYPLVLYYQVKWLDRPGITNNFGEKRSNIVCFKNGKKICTVSPYLSSEINNLFKTVYNDCVCNHFKEFNYILVRDKK